MEQLFNGAGVALQDVKIKVEHNESAEHCNKMRVPAPYKLNEAFDYFNEQYYGDALPKVIIRVCDLKKYGNARLLSMMVSLPDGAPLSDLFPPCAQYAILLDSSLLDMKTPQYINDGRLIAYPTNKGVLCDLYKHLCFQMLEVYCWFYELDPEPHDYINIAEKVGLKYNYYENREYPEMVHNPDNYSLVYPFDRIAKAVGLSLDEHGIPHGDGFFDEHCKEELDD